MNNSKKLIEEGGLTNIISEGGKPMTARKRKVSGAVIFVFGVLIFLFGSLNHRALGGGIFLTGLGIVIYRLGKSEEEEELRARSQDL